MGRCSAAGFLATAGCRTAARAGRGPADCHAGRRRVTVASVTAATWFPCPHDCCHLVPLPPQLEAWKREEEEKKEAKKKKNFQKAKEYNGKRIPRSPPANS